MPKALSYCHAYVGSQGQNAGGETTLHGLLKTLVADSWDVEVLLSEVKKDGTNNDYVVDGVKVRAFQNAEQLRQGVPTSDLVISHLGGFQRSAIVAKQNKIPALHVVHNDLNYSKAMSKHAQYNVYNTVWVLDSFRNSPYNRPPGMVVHPPVCPRDYETNTSREYITLVNLADGEGGPYNKGPEMFYRLANYFPNEKFLGVIGAYGNQDVRDVPNVTIVPNTEDIREIYAKSKIILSPSNYESYGRIAVEAGSSGIPSITSTAAGFEEHQVAYKRMHFQDTFGWQQALKELLEPEIYTAAAGEVKDKVQNLWKQSAQELSEYALVCRQLADRGKAARRKRRG